MKITPEKIRDIYSNTTPYQLEDVMKNYVGQKVSWDLKYSSLYRIDSKKILIMFTTDKNNTVSCEIDENVFPLIKIIPKNTLIKLIGTIKEVTPISINVAKAELYVIKDENGQIYFPPGSREKLLFFLESKILGSKNVKIYDPYACEDILRLLESTSPQADIKIMGNYLDSNFIKKVNAFNILYDRSIVVKKNNDSHARFYIIDNEVIQVDASLKNSGGNKATMVHIIDSNPETIIKEFDKWWSSGTKIN